MFIFLPDEADDQLTDPEKEGEEIKNYVSKVTVERTVVSWDEIDQHYTVKCVETNKDNTVDSPNDHKLIDKSPKGPVNHLVNKIITHIFRCNHLRCASIEVQCMYNVCTMYIISH